MSTEEQDPIFVSGIRELRWILVAWFVSCVWVVGYCYLFGYDVDPNQLTMVWGMPSWVFWGVLCPWIASTGFTAWFALFKVKDQSLPSKPLDIDACDCESNSGAGR